MCVSVCVRTFLRLCKGGGKLNVLNACVECVENRVVVHSCRSLFLDPRTCFTVLVYVHILSVSRSRNVYIGICTYLYLVYICQYISLTFSLWLHVCICVYLYSSSLIGGREGEE